MPQRLRQTFKFKDFSIPVSYESDAQGRMRDARNVFTNRNRLDTRHGIQRFNTYALGAYGFFLDISTLDVNKLDTENSIDDESVLSDCDSVTFFKKTDGTSYTIVKAGITLWSIASDGAHTALKTNLSASTKHRAITMTDRHIIVIGTDGFFTYDGTTFTQLGQDSSDTAVTVAASGSGNSLTASDYQVGFTWYASSIGFESNLSTASATVTVASGEQIDVSDIPTSADNELIDKKRIYFKDVTNEGEWLFWDEINLDVTTETIDDDASSTQTPPTKNARPLGNGAKFIERFGNKAVISGIDSFPSDVLFSEEYLPDAFDDSTSTRLVFKANGNGPITGIKVGYYTSDNLNPYICVFKKRGIDVYSELGGNPSYSTVSSTVGCVAPDSLQEIDGDIYFMSESGWHVISNGRLVEKKNKAFKLGDGDIDSIFTEEGFTYELNKSNFDNFFSVYYQTLNQYLTFVSESGNSRIEKAYNYEFDINGFRPYEFNLEYTCGCIGEDSQGNEIVILGGKNGRLYKHGTSVTKHDVDADNNSVSIPAFAQLYWLAHEDLDASLNFGTMIFKALSNEQDITVRCWLDYKLSDLTSKTYSFTDTSGSFILDVSKLDEQVLSDGRTIVRSLGSGIYKTSQSLLVGFYMDGIDYDMKLISGQIDASKNGNPN